MNIAYLLRYLWVKKWVVLIPVLVSIAIAWFFTRNEVQSFTSEAEISTGYMEVNPLDDGRSFNNTVLFNNVIQTLRSRQVLDPVSYELLLHDLHGNQPFNSNINGVGTSQLISKYSGGKKALIRSLTNKADSFYVLDLSKEEDRLIRQLGDLAGYSADAVLDVVSVKRIEGSDFIKIIATTTNPKLSAFIANAICREFLTFYQSKQGQASTSSLDTLKSIMEGKRQILDNKLKLLPEGDDFSVSSSIGMLGGLQAQLSAQKTNLIAAQVSLDNINKQIGAAGSPTGTSNNEEIISLKKNIDDLWSKYVANGSKDADLLERINGLRGQLQQKLSATSQRTSGTPVGDLVRRKMDLEVQVDVANQTIKDLQTKINSINGIVQSSASKQNLMQSMQNEIDVARQDYMNANRLYNEALNRNIFPGNDFKQTLIASPPLYPNPSKKFMAIGLAASSVFFLIVFFYIFLEFIDPSIKAPSYLRENVSFPLLANLQRINWQSRKKATVFSRGGSGLGDKLRFKEQIKQLRYELENSGHKIFLSASYHSGAGKTTVLKALAESLSLNKKKVLLIDANFRNNTLSKDFNATPSLSSVVLKMSDSPELVSKAVTVTDDENVQIVGCDESDHTPEELLPTENILSYFHNNAGNYDYILVDSAGLCSGPDCKELLRYVDSVLLVFAADQPLGYEDRKFIEFLERNHINTIGMVLNRINGYNMNV